MSWRVMVGMGMALITRLGEESRDGAGPDQARLGMARQGFCGMARHGKVRSGPVRFPRHGKARPGLIRRGPTAKRKEEI